MGDRRGHVHRWYPLPPRHLARGEVLVVDNVESTAGTADATVASHSEVDTVGIDVADLPRRQRRVMAKLS